MKTFRGKTGFLASLVLATCSLQAAYAQSVFLKYGPVAGIQKSTGSTYQNTAAASSDITTLFGCTTPGQFLNQAGGCTVPAGTGVTSVSQTVPAGFAVTGSPVVGSGTLAISYATGQTANLFLATPNGSTGAISERAIVGADVPPTNLATTTNGGVLSTSILAGTNGGTSNGFMSFTGPTTSLKTFTLPNASASILTSNAAVTVPQGGTGLATLTANGVLLGEGTSNINPLVMGADTVLRGTASADPVAAAVPNCGSSTTALNYSTTTHAFGCQTITAGGTGTVTSVGSGTGVTASPNPIISTGTLAIDQSFSPTWTGTHTFSNAAVLNAGTSGSGSTTGSLAYSLTNTGAGTTTSTRAILSNGSDGVTIGTMGTSGTGGNGVCSSAPAANHSFICSTGAKDLSVGTNAVERIRIGTATAGGFAFHGAALNYVAFGSITNNGSTCTLASVDTFGVTSCTRNSVGNITLNMANTTGVVYGCVATLNTTAGYALVTGHTSTTATISTDNTSSTLTDINFDFVCF